MATRAILDIEINDDAFNKFKERFDDYQAQLKTLPAEWARVGETMAGLSGIMEKISAASKAGSDNVVLVGKVTVDTNKVAADFGALWVGVSKSARFFHHDILGATLHLAKWTALTGVFSGLLAGGGLFGIARFAMNAAGQRQSAKALGVTPGEASSFIVNLGTMTPNPEELLAKFSEGFYSQGARNDFGAAFGAGIHDRMKGKDAATFFADILPDLKKKLDTVPESQLGNYLKSSHLANRGIDVATARNIRAMRPADVASLSQRLGADAREMNIPDESAKALQDLDTQLLETWNSLQANLYEKFAPLTPNLERLTTSFGNLASKALDEHGAIDNVIKEVGEGIEWINGELGTKDGREKLLTFVKDAGIAAVTMEVLAKAISGAMAASSIYGAWKMSGGILRWVASPYVLAAIAFYELFKAQPLNAGEDERARQLAHGIIPPPAQPLSTDTGAPRHDEPNRPGRPEDVYKPGEGKPTSHQLDRMEQGGSRQSSSSPTPSQNERAAIEGARTQTPGGPGSKATPAAMRTGGEPAPLDVVGRGDVGGVDKRLMRDVAAGAAHLPPGYKAEIFSGFRTGDTGAHGKGEAVDVQIVDPEGHVIRSRGEDPTGMYERMARSTYGEMLKRDPDLAERMAWGGSFGTRKGGGGEADLMHMDIMGRRGGVRPGYSKQIQELGPLGDEPSKTPPRQKESRLHSVGKHPVDVALMHRRPGVEIAMNQPGEWTVS